MDNRHCWFEYSCTNEVGDSSTKEAGGSILTEEADSGESTPIEVDSDSSDMLQTTTSKTTARSACLSITEKAESAHPW